MTLVTTRTDTECAILDCSEPQFRTYIDDNGNQLALCEGHYFEVVSRNTNDIPLE